MANRFSDTLFQLIHALEKAEKRHFKLYIKRSSAKEDLKIIQLFDALDKMSDYDERLLLKKLQGIEKPQLSNLKTHLYKQLLASLRLLKRTENIDLELNEQLDYARILYYKGLYLQSLKILDKVKEQAYIYHQDSILTQVISLEKKIELVAEKYIELIMKEPQLPLFMMSEIRNHGATILEKLPAANMILNSVFIKQFKEAADKGKISEPDPMHFLMNIMGLIVFPFISSPMIKKIGKLNDHQFDSLMLYRKKRIPVWVKAMFK